MAKSKKEPGKKIKASPKPAKKINGETTEPLSNYQTPVTGREKPEDKKPVKGMDILKVKLIDGGDKGILISYIKTEADGSTINAKGEEHEARVHPDLVKAFEKLAVHLGVLCFYISPKEIKDIKKCDLEEIDNFHVSAISYGGSEGDEGVTLTGHYTKNGKNVILNSPFQLIDEDEKTGYKFIKDFNQKCDKVIAETNSYLDGSKRWKDPQGELPFGENGKPEDAPYAEIDR